MAAQVRVVVVTLVACCLCICSSSSSVSEEEPWSPDAPARVAVIGAGFAGASAAIFLRDLFGANVSVTVFEASDRVGGRVLSVDLNGTLVEAGAGIAVDVNTHWVQLAERCHVELQPASRGRLAGPLGISDGSCFVAQFDGWRALPTFLYHYALSLPFLAFAHVRPVLDKFQRIYELQNRERRSFRDVAQMWQTLGLYEYTQRTLEEVLLVGRGRLSMLPSLITRRFVDEFVAGVTRINYNQSPAKMNALAGLVGLTPVVLGKDATLSVVGGNAHLVREILRQSHADLRLGCRIETVSPASTGSGYALGTTGESCTASKTDFDAVIIATPLESARIDLKVAGMPHLPARIFQQTISTFVSGNLSTTFFRVESGAEIPANIATVESATIPFSSIGAFWQKADGERLVKIFSKELLSEAVLDSMFDRGYTVHGVYCWDAYPRYSPPEKFTRFELARRLYYINGIETGASAMEVSAIGAKNVALLAAEDLGTASAGRSSLQASTSCTEAERCEQEQSKDDL